MRNKKTHYSYLFAGIEFVVQNCAPFRGQIWCFWRLNFFIRFFRQLPYYLVVLLIPIIVVVCLSVVAFTPPDCGECGKPVLKVIVWNYGFETFWKFLKNFNGKKFSLPYYRCLHRLHTTNQAKKHYHFLIVFVALYSLVV